MRPATQRLALGIIAATLALASASAQATKGGVYKWIDGQGNVHYDDINLLAERITRAELSSHTVEAEPAIVVPDEFATEVKRRCTDFGERSQSYRNASEFYGRSPSGITYRMSANEVALAKAQVEKQRNRFCRDDAARLILKEDRLALRAAFAAKQARAKKTAMAVQQRTP